MPSALICLIFPKQLLFPPPALSGNFHLLHHDASKCPGPNLSGQHAFSRRVSIRPTVVSRAGNNALLQSLEGFQKDPLL
jgi:hypothetical protein